MFVFVSECIFGKQVLELGSQWVPDLGVPIGVQYCFKCECLAVSSSKKQLSKRHYIISVTSATIIQQLSTFSVDAADFCSFPLCPWQRQVAFLFDYELNAKRSWKWQ